MKIINISRQTLIASQVQIADTVFSRLAGLLPRSSLAEQEALIITDCRAIHMIFMRFAIDAIFIGRDQRVVGVVKGIRPYRFSPYFIKASYVIESPEGTVERTGTQKGDKIKVEK